jgi:hypothetical protein
LSQKGRREGGYEEIQMLELADKDFKSDIINMLKNLKTSLLFVIRQEIPSDTWTL